jgi:hypothetical protein
MTIADCRARMDNSQRPVTSDAAAANAGLPRSWLCAPAGRGPGSNASACGSACGQAAHIVTRQALPRRQATGFSELTEADVAVTYRTGNCPGSG